jgi:hypothetical protein
MCGWCVQTVAKDSSGTGGGLCEQFEPWTRERDALLYVFHPELSSAHTRGGGASPGPSPRMPLKAPSAAAAVRALTSACQKKEGWRCQLDRQRVRCPRRGTSSWGCAPPLSHVPEEGGCACLHGLRLCQVDAARQERAQRELTRARRPSTQLTRETRINPPPPSSSVV